MYYLLMGASYNNCIQIKTTDNKVTAVSDCTWSDIQFVMSNPVSGIPKGWSDVDELDSDYTILAISELPITTDTHSELLI